MRRNSPWSLLAALSHVTVRLAPLPEGVHGACRERGGHAIILLSTDLDQVGRSITLGHELIHLERGGGCPQGLPGMLWDPVGAREEAAVDRELTVQLIPAGEFDLWLCNEMGLGHSVGAGEVSIEWAVPLRIANLALVAARARCFNR